MTKPAISTHETRLVNLPVQGRIAIMFGLYAAIGKSTIESFDMINFSVSAIAALSGELTVKVAKDMLSEPAPQLHAQVHRFHAAQQAQPPVKVQPANAEATPRKKQHYCGMKPGFLN